MIRIRGIDHVVVRVRELERMIDFYCNALGCMVEWRRDDLGLVHLRAGRSLIDLVPVDGPLGRKGGAAPGKEGRNVDHFCLRVESFDQEAMVEHLRDNGARIGAVAPLYGTDSEAGTIYVSDT